MSDSEVNGNNCNGVYFYLEQKSCNPKSKEIATEKQSPPKKNSKSKNGINHLVLYLIFLYV